MIVVTTRHPGVLRGEGDPGFGDNAVRGLGVELGHGGPGVDQRLGPCLFGDAPVLQQGGDLGEPVGDDVELDGPGVGVGGEQVQSLTQRDKGDPEVRRTLERWSTCAPRSPAPAGVARRS